MSKKIIVLMIPIILFLFSGCGQKPVTITEPTNLNKPVEPKKYLSEKECDKIRKETRELIDEINYCQTDQDCVVSTEFWCPFGCYMLHNNKADLNNIRGNISYYNENCPMCMYDCDARPKQNEIKCKNGKCTDTRYD